MNREPTEQAFVDVLEEFETITAKYARFHSAHEAYGVLLEEVDELWDEVKRRDSPERLARIREEAIQVAAVALRIVAELGPRT